MDKTGKLSYYDVGINDMTNLVELSDESLLWNVQSRYSQKLIYTYIGSILISINPYTELGIYSDKHIRSYQNKALNEMPPHLFGIGDTNYNKMMMDSENQVIVISGESGSGKTESFKRILKYLAVVSGGVKTESNSKVVESADIAKKILDSTPLLESFGNAKTIRNDNSSRFGKYVEIFFEDGFICGSRITNYLLEQSRIVNINQDERGYHIFYEILQGLDAFSKSQYCLKGVKDYAYLNSSGSFTVKDRNDALCLTEFMNQWHTLGLTNDDLDVTLRMLSAVLHLGNIQFMEEDDVSYLVETENVQNVGKMLKIDWQSLKNCLTMKMIDTVKEVASSPVKIEQALNFRDTLAKHLYSELFNWIIGKVNRALNENTVTLKRTPSHLDRSILSSQSKIKCIAMLDIYGFENFPDNSLEQLCINYANETLQQFFNRYVFELEQTEYKQEGIGWHYITYPDNQPIIDLLSSKPSGIIQILNDECSIPQGSDEAFLQKCVNVHLKHQNFEKVKKVHPPQFIIRHFAGNISYNVTGFLEKNRDILRKELMVLIESSGVQEISEMFKNKRNKLTKNPISKARTPAVMADFQNSLSLLLNKMKVSQPWFIRCLKPNGEKKALTFNKDIVMDQMKYTGILETVKIRKSGFPIRIVFTVFLSRFYLLQDKEGRHLSKSDPKESCLRMMLRFKGQRGKTFEIGKTKLFLKEEFARRLEIEVRKIRERSAIVIQRKWREYWKRRLVIIQNQAATLLQSIARGFIVRRRMTRFRAAMIKLQAFVKMQLARRQFLREHPQFRKISAGLKQNGLINGETGCIAYNFPEPEEPKSSRKKPNKALRVFDYNTLKIPTELAILLDKAMNSYGVGHLTPEESPVIITGRTQHIWNRNDCSLPKDIDDYLLENYLDEYGNAMKLESQPRPVKTTFLSGNIASANNEICLNAHKLILRLIHVDNMSPIHRYLMESFLCLMARKSPMVEIEIFIQLIAETIVNKNIVNPDLRRLQCRKAWKLLGNILSFTIPIPNIFNYILKYVSDSFGNDQAEICQEKLLQLMSPSTSKISRIFPPSNLECQSNFSGTKTSLKICHPDGHFNSIHINSFSTAETIASHSLCFRLSRYKMKKGWSISIITSDMVIDCGGHNYIFDAISGKELPSCWAEVSGCDIEEVFLISKKKHFYKQEKETLSSQHIPLFMSKGQRLQQQAPNKYQNIDISSYSSKKSMDTWLKNNFEVSFLSEDPSSFAPQNFIHGLEDELPNNTKVSQPQQTQITTGNPIVPQPSYGNLVYSMNSVPVMPAGGYSSQPQYYGQPAPSRTLEEQLNFVQLENKIIQSSIEKELLQSRLDLVRQQNTFLSKPVNLMSPIGYQVQPQYVPSQYIQPQYIQPPHSFNNVTLMSPQPLVNTVFPNNEKYENTSKKTISSQTAQLTDSGSQTSVYSVFPQPDISSVEKVPRSVRILEPSLQDISSETLSSVKSLPVDPIVIPPAPMAPPPPPPVVHMDEDDVFQNEDSTDGRIINLEQNHPRLRRKSIVKYSESTVPSTIIVDDSQILPVYKDEEKKSYLRASEVPKVDIANRAAFLEAFFEKKKSMPMAPETPKKKKYQAPLPPVNDKDVEYFENDNDNLPTIPSISLTRNISIIPRPKLSTSVDTLPINAKSRKKQQIEENGDISLTSYSTTKMEMNPPNDTFVKPYAISKTGRNPHSGVSTTPFPTTRKNQNLSINSYQPVLDELDKSISLASETFKTTLEKQPRKRRFVSDKKAIILSGLPDLRYNSYANSLWFPMLRREIFLPGEVHDNAMLNSVIFCQIVRDLLEFPCNRWVSDEKQRLISLLGNYGNVKDINIPLNAPKSLMLKVIDEAQKCELYFSRFYSIKWHSRNVPYEGYYWIAVSHTGIRFVEQNMTKPKSPLHITSHIKYDSIVSIKCENLDLYDNPTLLIIKVKSAKYQIQTAYASSIYSLISEFRGQQENNAVSGTLKLENTNGYSPISPERRGYKKDLLKESILLNGDLNASIYGVNKERIPVKYVFEKEKPKKQNANNGKNLFDFVALNSRYKVREDIINKILKWEPNELSEPILPFLNVAQQMLALEVNKELLMMIGEIESIGQRRPSDHAKSILKKISQNRELNDEMILQIFKQISGNPNSRNRQMLWNFLSCVVLFVGVSKRMEMYFENHIKQVVKNPENSEQHLAVFVSKNYKIFSKYGNRKDLPTTEEMKMLLNGQSEGKLTVLIPQGSKDINVSFNSTVGDVIRMLCKSVDIDDENEILEYALMVSSDSKQQLKNPFACILKPQDYIYDNINSLMKQKLHCNFYFKRVSWIFPLDVEKRPDEFINLIFNQLSEEITSGDWILPDDNTFTMGNLEKITSLAYYCLRGQGYEGKLTEEVLKLVLPDIMLNPKVTSLKRSKLITMINGHANDTNGYMNQMKCRRQFLVEFESFPRFGTIKCQISDLNEEKSNGPLFISFDRNYVFISDNGYCKPIVRFRNRNLSNFNVKPIDSKISKIFVKYEETKEIRFRTNDELTVTFFLSLYKTTRNLILNR